MSKLIHPVEKLMQTIIYKGVEFEVVERPEVLWVGCVDYAKNNTDESDISATLNRYRGLFEIVPIEEKMCPDWSAALSINYNYDKEPCGIMFANESYTDKQDERYDLFTQPGGLWLRVSVNEETDSVFLGRKNYGTFEYFSILSDAAQVNNYKQNPHIHMEVEYHCHAEYNNPTHKQFAYIPVCSK